MARDLDLKVSIHADGKQAVSATQDVSDSVRGIGDAAQAAEPSMGGLLESLKPFGTLALGFNEINEAIGRIVGYVQPIIELADAQKTLAARLKLVVDEGQAFDAAMAAVRQSANATGADINTTGELFTRLAQAGADLGLSQSDLAELTDTIGKAFAVSGSSGAEMDGAVRQLTQALAIAAVQAQARRRILRVFVRRGLIEKCDAEEMAGWDHGGGFSVDAAVRIEGNDRAGLERLLRYCARPPSPSNISTKAMPSIWSITAPSQAPTGPMIWCCAAGADRPDRRPGATATHASPPLLWRAGAQCAAALGGDSAGPCRRPASTDLCGERRGTQSSLGDTLSVGHAAGAHL